MMMSPTITELSHISESDLNQLCDILADCVAGGASVSFMEPLTPTRASAYWRGIAQAVEEHRCALLVARLGQQILGTVHLMLDLPENQPHRADLCKLLVRRDARGRGVAHALMTAVEPLARSRGKDLLVLDTASDTAARLYRRLGWKEVGSIPRYALMPDGTPCATTFFYLQLEPGARTANSTAQAFPG